MTDLRGPTNFKSSAIGPVLIPKPIFLVSLRRLPLRGTLNGALLVLDAPRVCAILDYAKFKPRLKELQYSDDGRLF